MAEPADAAGVHGTSRVFESITPLLRDEQYTLILKRLEPRKRGRTSLQEKLQVPINNRLLLQLHLARQDSSCPVATIQTLFDELCTAAEVPGGHVARHLIQTSVYQLESQCSQVDSQQVDMFLSENLDKLQWLGEYSKKYSVSLDLLLSISSGHADNISAVDYIPNGLLNELNIYRNRNNFRTEVLLLWLRALCTDFAEMNCSQLNKLLKKVTTTLKQLQRRKGDPGGISQLQEYKDSSCLLSSPSDSGREATSTLSHSGEASSSSLLSASAVVSYPVGPLSHPFSQSPSSGGSLLSSTQEISLLQAPSTESEQQDTLLPTVPQPHPACPQSASSSTLMGINDMLVKETEVTTLREIIGERDQTIRGLKEEVSRLLKTEQSLNEKLRAARESEKKLTQQLQEKRKECSTLKKANLYRRCSRLKNTVKQQQQQLRNFQGLQGRFEEEKVLKRRAQIRCCQLQAKKRKLEQALEEKEQVIIAVEQEEGAVAFVPPATRDATGKFVEPVVKCVMELVGENEVPAGRCSDVMRTVARNIFNTTFEDLALPSKTSALRFADQVHSVAHMHIAEELALKKYDLHLDGTSKNTKKYVGMQVTLQDKTTLSLGFDPVAHETAQTLLDLALSKLTEFALLQSPDDADQQLKNMLRNLVGIMSDRAATMKAFDNQMDEHIKRNIDPAIQVEFLHCNAHFLLGLTMAADKALTEVAEAAELQGKLGRDAMPAFQRFKTHEAAACRYIRMACDTLGPRGDEKSGCHHLWLAFCSTQEESSAITSFRANRFNNLFSAAAALIHHRQHIISFFEHRTASNLKQRSVEADARCDQLAVMLLGLALMYVYVCGPFWCLVNSDVHYLDQYMYIQPLFFFLRQVEDHPEILLGGPDELPHEIESFRMCAPRTPTAESVLRFKETVAAADRELLHSVLKALAMHFRRTMERQLADFLCDGKNGHAPDEEARQRMEHCQLTNLLGEACFADLDYSRFKNRASTLHHHSTLNLGKRNHPISRWLSRKPPEEQSLLLAKARKLAPGMRTANKQKQLIVLEELNEAMQEQERNKAAKEQKLLQAKHKVMADIQAQGGACKTSEEVENLLESCSTKTVKTAAMKLQCRYYREFFGAKLPLTNLSPEQLAANLSEFLQTNLPANADPMPVVDAPDEDEEEDALPVPEELENDTDTFDFQYTGQGQSVAVYYDDRFYLGQVLMVHRPDLADVTFMEQRGEENVFKWPSSDTIEQVAACFVFFSDFDLVEKHRVWAVREAEWASMKRRWRQFLQHAEQLDA